MIPEGETIVLIKVANGIAIYPEKKDGVFFPGKEMMVFNHIGYASGDEKCPTDETLLGFIAKHFGEA